MTRSHITFFEAKDFNTKELIKYEEIEIPLTSVINSTSVIQMYKLSREDEDTSEDEDKVEDRKTCDSDEDGGLSQNVTLRTLTRFTALCVTRFLCLFLSARVYVYNMQQKEDMKTINEGVSKYLNSSMKLLKS
ncbi:hypothetical protein C1645_737173 [Glomus cerebriforme]|uniref:Uncharacterized protein n=1 Tax=Glomus cerebriforme TaxID=658196 RepID=A0A397T8R0_9GLOM|nr:hypothetical protein C1645_737173 [Glomus cerebriforme]